MRRIRTSLGMIVLLLLLTTSGLSKEKPSYDTGKLIDVSVQDVVRGIGVIGGMAAPIPGKLYTFKILVGDLVYISEFKAGKLSYRPEWVVNDAIAFRFGKDDRMFLKRPDGKELEVLIVKRVRQQ